MTKKELEQIQFRLSFKPHGEEVLKYIDWYRSDIPNLLHEIRKSRENRIELAVKVTMLKKEIKELKHRWNCAITQSGCHVEVEET